MHTLFESDDLPRASFFPMSPTNKAPPFWRTSTRYEVALDVLGGVISHCAHAISKELENANSDSNTINLYRSAQEEIRSLRDRLNPQNSIEIEAVIARYAPLVKKLFGASDLVEPEQRRTQFAQINASLALEGLIVNSEDLALQERIISGAISADEAAKVLAEKFRKSSF